MCSFCAVRNKINKKELENILNIIKEKAVKSEYIKDKSIKNKSIKDKNVKKNVVIKSMICAFPHTIPILAGFLFLGIAYGIYMNVSGFSFVYPMIMSFVIYGGSLEFVTVSMLLSAFAPLQSLVMAVMIQARHLFYGIAMLDKYKNIGIKKYYLIYGMCDETFSINYSADIPEDVDKGWFYVWVTVFNQLYWVGGATLGGILGNLITFNTEGLDFVMTAMFVVIFMEQWFKEKKHLSELIGMAASIGCLIIFGADNFMIPTMICIVVMLTITRKSREEEITQECQ